MIALLVVRIEDEEAIVKAELPSSSSMGIIYYLSGRDIIAESMQRL